MNNEMPIIIPPKVTIAPTGNTEFEIFDEDKTLRIVRPKGVNQKSEFMFIRESAAQIERLLLPALKDASTEIEFCHRYESGEIQPTANLRAYGIVSGGGGSFRADEVAAKLLPVYREWRRILFRHAPTSLGAIQMAFFEGHGLRQIMSRYRLSRPENAGRHIVHGLNEYCILRGWGDVWGEAASSSHGYVYVIGPKENGPYKVGHTKTPKKRLKAIQVGHTEDLHIHHLTTVTRDQAGRVETYLHRHLKKWLHRGEWYNMDLEDLIDLIRVLYPAGENVRFSIDT
ncbi:MAG: hypothetical protein DI551_07975 [Micavibrio aeruginosavorus]|uniref:Bacteriophage T5 Orf172 DNA-binding domain-containing protein n=1 Tax=Micavibrio aeruginosavorus TaxID=349221 RepID=A0A2W5PKX2_9BACT|nr:MAG: hypothetical protein DI551_07975 [Micavibrio aeruginosavorus]